MAGKDGIISATEFERWLTPLRAQQVLSEQWDIGVIRSTLAGLVGHDLLGARAKVMIMNVGRSNEARSERVLVHTTPWTSDMPGYHSSFWENGRFDYRLGDRQFGVEIANHGVRFDPDGVMALLERGPTEQDLVKGPEPATSEGRKTRHGMPALKDELLDSWHTLFVAAYPQGSKELGEVSAHGMFPNHSVDRKKVRDLIGKKPKGRPLENKRK